MKCCGGFNLPPSAPASVRACEYTQSSHTEAAGRESKYAEIVSESGDIYVKEGREGGREESRRKGRREKGKEKKQITKNWPHLKCHGDNGVGN
jgi:hypothetical protein